MILSIGNSIGFRLSDIARWELIDVTLSEKIPWPSNCCRLSTSTSSGKNRDIYPLKVFRSEKNVVGRLLYFGRKSSIDCFSLLLSPTLTNSSEIAQVGQAKCSIINQSQLAYISLRWVALNDWLLSRLLWSLDTHWLSDAAYRLVQQREFAAAVLISDPGRSYNKSISTTLTEAE